MPDPEDIQDETSEEMGSEEDVLCASDGCPNLAHGRSPWCPGHKRRREKGQSLSTPLRSYERDPDRSIMTAIHKWVESFESRRQQLEEIAKGGNELRNVCAAALKRAQVSAEDDAAWRRADKALRKALSRYRRSKGKTASR